MECVKSAISNKHVDVLNWLSEFFNLAQVMVPEDLCSRAADSGSIEMLKFLREKNVPWNEDTCEFAAQAGNLKILKWARDHGCPWNEGTCTSAAYQGNLEILKWARDHGCPWNKDTCAGAAEGGNLEILKWAREHGCPWDERTCLSTDDPKILKWAFQNGCPCPHSEIFMNAAETGNSILLDWAIKNLTLNESTKVTIWHHAARGGHVRVLACLQKNSGVLLPGDFLQVATSCKDSKTFLWLLKNVESFALSLLSLPPDALKVMVKSVGAKEYPELEKEVECLLKINK